MDLFSAISNLSTTQIYGLFFLLGSLTVSSISDFKRMAAQSEFFHFWTIFTVLMFGVDIYPKLISMVFDIPFIVKWIAIPVIVILSYKKIGILFSVNKMDVAALAAVMSIFDIYTIVLLVVIMKPLSLLIKKVFGKKAGLHIEYPYLPVITVSTGIILLLNLIMV